MKKLIKSLVAFFSFKNKRVISGTPKQGMYTVIAPEKVKPAPVYEVYLDHVCVGHYENLNQVAKAFSELKKTTLYKAFKDENNSSRTYSKGIYEVVEA